MKNVPSRLTDKMRRQVMRELVRDRSADPDVAQRVEPAAGVRGGLDRLGIGIETSQVRV
jgi:hypothetical protein